MQRLTSKTAVSAQVVRPAYDRSALKRGIVHIGVGSFHRAHQAVYTDAALEHSFADWGIIGISLRSREIVQNLNEQDGLYSVVTRDVAGDDVRIVGSMIGAVAASEERERVLALLAAPDIRIVTLTVSEKAYGIDPVTGGLDLAHVAVAADIANPNAPSGVIGYIVEALSRRRAAGLQPFTVLCCDNLPDNGHVVARLVEEMAALREPALARWISDNGAFPSSMVDRIVPASTAETLSRAQGLLGAEDRLAIETEAFTQWVIEDRFVSGRPYWEAGGALFVENVEPYEKMKLRLLNGSHSLIAYLGQLRGLEFVRDVMALEENVAIVRRHMRAAALTLDPVPGIELDTYMESLIDRFANPAIAHRTRQIAMDGSQKMSQRIFTAAVETLAAGKDADEFAYVTALWITFLRRAETIDDPRAAELRAAAMNVSAFDSAGPFFDIPGLFPIELVNSRNWRDRVNARGKSL